MQVYATGVPAMSPDEYEGSLAALLAAADVWTAVTLTVWICTSILVLAWIHRANYNARRLGASDMIFTPGWAVGWYFVPVAWFWKPYQAMKEIWRVSASPSDWRDEGGSGLLGWWWALWIVPFWGLGVGSQLAIQGMEETQAERLEGMFGFAMEVFDIPLALVMLVIIGRVYHMQMGHWSRQLTEAAEAQQSVE